MRTVRLATAMVSGIAAAAALIVSYAATPTLAGTPGGGCTATARVDSEWGSGPLGGQIVTVTCDNGTTTTPPAPDADVTVGRPDNTRTLTLRVGQTLAVDLPAGFRKPDLTGSALTELSSSGGGTTGEPLTVLYRAAAEGSETLRSDTPEGARWWVGVVVVGTSPSGSGETVVVSAPDNQRSISLAVGDILVVSLPGMYVPPAVTPDGVLSLSTITGGYPTGDPLLARYVAAAPGQVTVSTISDALCRHEPTPCPSPQVRWSLTVSVS